MFDKGQLKRWWDIFVGEGGFTEVRILGKFQYSGYFKSFENLVKEIEPYTDMDNEQIYFVLNQINPDCYGRQQCEKMVKSPKMTTTDGDIIMRNYVLLDFDPIRATGVNSSEEELKFAHTKAREVMRYLRTEGFKDPVVCKSGNGYHLILRVSMPNDDDTTEILKKFLQSMGKMFSDEHVEVDEKVFNAGRISKLYGTVAKKGANIQERPWRMSEILYVPENFEVNDISLFEKIAALLPPEEPKQQTQKRQYNGQGQFDLRSWLDSHGISYKEDKQGNSTRFTLEYCPWVDTHSEKKKWDSALFLDPDGKITFNCQHSHCKDKQWQDVRLFYEPDAYTRPVYQPQYQPRLYGQKPQYKVKEEIPELGAKWMSMSSISKLDLTNLKGVKTGVIELDRNIVQLNYGEVSLLSGGNASGKSSWLNTLVLNAVEQGVPSALWSGELPSPILKTWIQMAAAGKKNLLPSSYGNGKFYVPNGIGKRIDAWMEGKFFLYNNEYGCQWEQIFADMQKLLSVGVKLFVLDNLMSLNIDLLEGDKNNKQKELILQIKDFAKKNDVHIILVAHPRKTTAFLRKNDISGTSDITNAVDNVFIVHRVNNDFFRAGADFFGEAMINQFRSYGNVIEVAKNRMYGVVDLLVGLHYEIESRRFKNTEYENIQYGWEHEPEQMQMPMDNEPYEYQEPSDYDENGMPFEPPIDDAPF